MPNDSLLTLQDVMHITQLSRSRLYRYIADNTFPKPIKFESVARWSELEIQAWIQRKREETNNSSAA